MSGFGASKRCTHILVTGHRCGSPALRGQYLCYFHARLMGRVTGRIDGTDCITHFESEESIQFALMSLLSRTLVGKIDLPRANFAIKVLNLAVRNSRRARFNCSPDDIVQSLPSYSQQYLAEHPQYADPERLAAKRSAAAKGLATRRANEQAREAKRQERAAFRAARKNQSAAATSVRENSTDHPSQSFRATRVRSVFTDLSARFNSDSRRMRGSHEGGSHRIHFHECLPKQAALQPSVQHRGPSP